MCCKRRLKEVIAYLNVYLSRLLLVLLGWSAVMFAQTILNHTVNSVPFILLIWLHSHWCHLSTSVTLLLLLGSVHVLLKHLHIGSWWLCTLWLRTEAHFLHMSCSALYCSINCWLLTVELYGTPLPPKRLCGNEAMLHLCPKMYKMCKKSAVGATLTIYILWRSAF